MGLPNVSFTHQESGFSLKNINLNLTSGNIFGITGFSGSGKSTLVDILMGLLNPEKGSIIVFPSFMPHCVTPVTKGVRTSLVMWCLGEPWK